MTFNLDPAVIHEIIKIFFAAVFIIFFLSLIFIHDSMNEISNHLKEQNEILKQFKKGKK